MNAHERSQAIITDILHNHLPRIKEGLEKGYVDENQVLIVYDHLVRARILEEIANGEFAEDAKKIVQHIDNLEKINQELEAEKIEGEVRGDIPRLPQRKLVNVPAAGIPCGIMKEVDEIVATQPVPRSLVDEIQQGMAIIVARNEMHSDVHYVQDIKADGYPEFTKEKGKAKVFSAVLASEQAKEWTHKYADMSFYAEAVSDLNWKPHVEKLACVCGGVIKDDPQFTGDVFLKCNDCGRTFLGEMELAEARRTETKVGKKFVDATYWSTGTLIGGTTPVPMETEISLNGDKTTIKAKDGKFVLSYEQIVRMACNQFRKERGRGPETCSDEELPMFSLTYHHRVPFAELTGERNGSLCRGQRVECTPGMSITCLSTSNA